MVVSLVNILQAENYVIANSYLNRISLMHGYEQRTREWLYCCGYFCSKWNPYIDIDREKGLSAELREAWKQGYADGKGDQDEESR